MSKKNRPVTYRTSAIFMGVFGGAASWWGQSLWPALMFGTADVWWWVTAVSAALIVFGSVCFLAGWKV